MSLENKCTLEIDIERAINILCDDFGFVGVLVEMWVAPSSSYPWATRLDLRLSPVSARLSSSKNLSPNI